VKRILESCCVLKKDRFVKHTNGVTFYRGGATLRTDGALHNRESMLKPQRPIFTLCALVTTSSVLGYPADESTVLDVPFVRQIRAGCGSAAISMVMQYWVRQQPWLNAAAADAEQIDKKLPPSSSGLSGEALKRYLETHGFSAFLFDGELRDIHDHLEKGRPLVVCLGLKGSDAQFHFVVVVGESADAIILNDPARGKLVREPMAEFLHAWKVTGNWSLLAVPRRHS
jgi:predicted double-glycine peptidase